MAGNLSRFEPRGALTRFEPMRNFGNLFDVFSLMQPLRGLNNEQVRIDISETDQAYLVKAEMPGIKKEDIKVAIQGDEVNISAESGEEQERKEGNIVCRERYHGKVYRSFTLPQSVDEDSATASVHDGILELTLPKKTGAGAKQLTIQ